MPDAAANGEMTMEERKEARGHSKRGTEITLMIIVGILSILIIAGILYVYWLITKEDAPLSSVLSGTARTDTALSTLEDRLPLRLAVGKEPPDARFQTENGQEVTLRELTAQGKQGVWLVFWASWCPDCSEQFKSIAEMERLANQYGYALILIDRLNPEKESVEAAKAKLKECGATARCVYDDAEACYQAWGMREIPSSVILDSAGIVREYKAGVITPGVCEGLLRRARDGRDSAVRTYLDTQLSNGQGGYWASTSQNAPAPSGTDVLSESQGLMLRYALQKDDQKLFSQVWQYTREHLWKNGLTAWYTRGNDPADVNALVDDLRVWYALRQAASRWGGNYRSAANASLTQIRARCLNTQGGLVDFTMFSTGKQADTISLCYLDLEILQAMAEDDSAFRPTLAQARELVQNGRISDDFPLYYSSYSYTDSAYSEASLNTAEALYTLWNLSRVDLLPADALDWLRQRVTDGDLAARYLVSGVPETGFTYHSTAVYALAALIAQEEEDDALFELALRRMERNCVLDADDPNYGAYAQKGATVYAFDQLMPLLVNASIK